jgi:hypothetical protein
MKLVRIERTTRLLIPPVWDEKNRADLWSCRKEASMAIILRNAGDIARGKYTPANMMS